MAQAHRYTALPQPGTTITTRDLYSPASPAFRRSLDHHHQSRSPSFPVPSTVRRLTLSPTISPHAVFAPLRMEPGLGGRNGQSHPPLNPITTLGVLHYGDPAGTHAKFDITGNIDKGFFLADNEWTCYRRNYFSCVCSFSLAPHYPGQQIHYVPSSGPQSSYVVQGFAMTISAIVADGEGQPIDLVQHTPKRDKGPVAKPEKVRLQPKPAQQQQFPQMGQSMGHMALYGESPAGPASTRSYDQPYGQTPPQIPTEHTFERIQFKQATANNGKRRAAQQYYHLVIELYADVGEGGNEELLRIGFRQSAKMIVRGRSPGHYQGERRGSAGSGPPAGSEGGFGGGGSSYGGSSSVYGSNVPSHAHLSTGTPLSTSNPYPGGGSYDPRQTSSYGTRQHQPLPAEPSMSTEEVKNITEPKGYQYYPSTIYENGEQDGRNHVEVYQNHSREGSTIHPPSGMQDMSSGSSKIKSEYENGVSNVFYSPPSLYSQRCGRFDGKTSSTGYYPTMVPPTSSMNIT